MGRYQSTIHNIVYLDTQNENQIVFVLLDFFGL